VCFDFLSNFCLKQVGTNILRRIQRGITIKDKCLHVKYPSFLSDCKETLIFVTEFRKVVKYQIS